MIDRTGQVWAYKYNFLPDKKVFMLVITSDAKKSTHTFFAFYDTGGGPTYHSIMQDNFSPFEEWADFTRII